MATTTEAGFKGERISRDLLEHLAPQLCIQVDRTSAQGEGIPRFLKGLDEMIARDPYLQRFRGKQETIKLLGGELKKAAQAQASNLQERLDRQQG
jgi:glutamine synthetase adenylyltransferase